MKNQHETPEALAHTLFTAAQLAPGEGIEDAVGRLAALVDAQQPTPSAAAMNFDPHAELRKTWQPGQRWQTRTMRHGVWGDWSDTISGRPLWFAHQQYRRHPDEIATQPAPTPQADSQPAPVVGYPPLPRVGAIGYASVVDIDSYAKTLTIGPHLPGVRDIALWTTDQMRAYVDADRAARAPADSVLEDAGGANWQDISTAPEDGTRFVAVGNNYGLYSETQHVCIAQWFRGCWMEVSDWNEASELKYLTHWMPLLQLPGNAARAPEDSVTAPAATPSAASLAWTALRDLTDPLGEAGVKIMGHVRIYAQRQYEAGLTEGRATPPAPAADSVLEDAALLKEARDALWQPANAALCERIDAYLDRSGAVIPLGPVGKWPVGMGLV